MRVSAVPVEEVPSDCFVATMFRIGVCPCGCGLFKLVGFDEGGVARAIISIEPGQLAQMAATLLRAPQESLEEKGTKH